MSNEMVPECLKHTDNRHVQVRIDYMLIYRNESKAKIIRVLESWTDTKYAEWYKGIANSKEQNSEPPTEDLWITMSYDQFSLFVYGTIKHDTIKQQVDELVALKHIQRRPNPEYPYGPPQYLLNRKLIQKLLNELEIPANLFDLVPIFVSPRKKPTTPESYPHPGGKKPTRAGVKNQGGDPGKLPPPTGESSYPSNNISKNTKNHPNNQDTYSDPETEQPTEPVATANADRTHTPNQIALSEDWLAREHAPDAMICTNSYLPDGSVYSARDEEQPRQGPATKARSAQHARWQKQLPSMLTEESLTPTEQRALHAHLAECPACSQLDQQRQAILAAIREQAAPKAQLSTSQQSSPQARAKVAPKVAESVEKPPQVPPVMPPADAAWKTTTCLQMFNAWRGVPLIAKHQCMKASQCAKALAEHYTREQVERVRTDMVERDPWWSLHPEKVDVCSVAEHIHEKLSEIGRTQAKKQASAQGTKPTSTMSGMRRLGS